MSEREQRVAVTSRDGVSVNERFHRARDFFVFAVPTRDPAAPRFLERRPRPDMAPGAVVPKDGAVFRDFDRLAALLSDCTTVVSLGFTAEARRELSGRGFALIETRGALPEALGGVSSQSGNSPGLGDPASQAAPDLPTPGGASR